MYYYASTSGGGAMGICFAVEEQTQEQEDTVPQTFPTPSAEKIEVPLKKAA